jgi:putative permease
MQLVVKRWINRYLGSEQAVLMILLLGGAGLVLWALGAVLAPVLAALVVAFMLQGLINRLMAVGLGWRLGFVLTYSLFLALFLAAIFGLVPLLIKQASLLAGELPQMLVKIRALINELPDRYAEYISPDQLQELWGQLSRQLGEVGQQLLSFSLNSVVDLVALLVYLVLVPLLVFFMLKDRQQLTDLLSRLLPSERGVLTRVGSEMNTQLGNYVRGKAIEIALVGAASYAAFLVLGLNYAALLALAVGLSVLIPYVGALVVTAPVLFVGYVQWGSGSEFLWLFGVYAVIQFLDGNVLVPLLFSEVVDLHPVAIIVAVLVFGGLWGFWGVFFAIPLATLVKALYSAWPRQPRGELIEQESLELE